MGHMYTDDDTDVFLGAFFTNNGSGSYLRSRICKYQPARGRREKQKCLRSQIIETETVKISQKIGHRDLKSNTDEDIGVSSERLHIPVD